MRIIYNNAADRATITASSTAGALGAAFLKNNYKGQAWRSTGTSATLTLEWTTAETIAGVALAFTQLTSTATVRLRGYTNIADASPVFDTGNVVAAPGAALGYWHWGGAVLGVNAYAYAGGAYGRAWVPTPAAVRKLVIDIIDTNNPAGYIEVGRLIAGNYWEPVVSADYGASVSPVDTSVQSRNGAGDQMVEAGTIHNKLTFTMSKMAPADRDRLWEILRGNGKARPIYINLFPNDPDTSLEQIYQVYGRLVTSPAMAMPSFKIAAASLDIEEI